MSTQVESWVATTITANEATLRVLKNSIPLTITGTLRERSNRIHSAATESLKQVLMEKMQSGTADDADGKPRPSPKPLALPANSSPFAVRLAYISASLQTSLEEQKEFAKMDQRIDDWELDLAASDVSRFDQKVRAMVTGVVAALIGREYDTRLHNLENLGIEAAVGSGVLNALKFNDGKFIFVLFIWNSIDWN